MKTTSGELDAFIYVLVYPVRTVAGQIGASKMCSLATARERPAAPAVNLRSG